MTRLLKLPIDVIVDILDYNMIVHIVIFVIIWWSNVIYIYFNVEVV
jgi:hypothetical protein